MKVKPLVWAVGPVSRFNNIINFDVAVTPFGEYKVWYPSAARPKSSLWVPQLAEHSQYDSVEEAKRAAYRHLCGCISEAVEE